VRLFKFFWRVVDTYLLGFFFPPFCCSCTVLVTRGNFLCSHCSNKIKPIVSTYVPVTTKHKLKVFAVSSYEGPLRSLILRKRFSDMLASKQLATLIYEKTCVRNMSYDYIVPIPLHWTRRLRRGYNQAEVMSKDLGSRLGVPVLNLLQRERMTAYQSRLPVKLRQENVRGAFKIKKEYLDSYKDLVLNKKILFIDDLCTTGSTLKYAARLLGDAKPKELAAAVACRVV
jgi:competence protein ComFC